MGDNEAIKSLTRTKLNIIFIFVMLYFGLSFFIWFFAEVTKDLGFIELSGSILFPWVQLRKSNNM